MTDDPEPAADEYFADLYRLAGSTDIPLEEKIERAIEIGRDRLGATHGVLSYTGDGQYEVLDSTIESGKYAPGGVSELATTWCRHVVDERDVLGFGDVDDSEYADDVARESTGLHCYLGAPVVVDNESFGTLCFSSPEPRDADFTETERRFVALLAKWVSFELERDKHHRELRRQNERLDEFVGIVAHDLRNPLSTAMGYTELALEEAEGQQREFLETVDGAIDRMEALIADLLELARNGCDVGQREAVDLAALARDAWNHVSTPEASLTLRTDATVYANRSRLQQLLENAFRNAVEHAGDDVTVTVRDTDDGFAIEDDGPGLPDHIEGTLFSEEVERESGAGLGLLIIERVVNGHGWKGSVHSDDTGTVFEFHGVGRATPTAVLPEQTA
ncbi:GAF domain-containing protein [Halobaculum sp. WSA2]|uniref:histidine kinase n=1 Tax=Halobaculum saliterrae TaxID=2073113 RepID=A0A6B0SUA5_9EURY|nr:GAF domain-containing sensor histidine kinase [Halobaculum saliterrae]MXR40193.1 GAF domain-containing protein [Halobaculum saliterrae]